MTAKVLLYLFMTLLSLSSGIFAQTLTEARKLYETKHYAEAKPVFQRYVKQVPSNGNYNLWYGVCCLQTGDIPAAVQHLEVAVRKRIPSGQLWLGQAYDKAYRFEDAIATLESYITDLKRRRRSTQEADSLMNLTRLHLRMFKGVERVCIIDSFVVSKKHFLEKYHLSSQAGRLLPYAEYFPASNREGKTVYENELGNKILYSEVNRQGFQHLKSSTRLLDKWTQGAPLSLPVSDSINAAYPYLMSDGITLYYASDGPESMGGYDIFVTRYNTNTDSYLRPDNVGMPFNSPYNDYMYVVDEYANLGWFASDRYQPADSVCIYVFIPNASKQVYDYEQTDATLLRSVASLQSLRDTWFDRKQVSEAKERLNKIEKGNISPTESRLLFQFVIDDHHTYCQETDFRSPQALELFQQYKQKLSVLQHQQAQLEDLRDRFAAGDQTVRNQLRPAILDLENRIFSLDDDIDNIARLVRNAEIQAISHP